MLSRTESDVTRFANQLTLNFCKWTVAQLPDLNTAEIVGLAHRLLIYSWIFLFVHIGYTIGIYTLYHSVWYRIREVLYGVAHASINSYSHSWHFTRERTIIKSKKSSNYCRNSVVTNKREEKSHINNNDDRKKRLTINQWLRRRVDSVFFFALWIRHHRR